MQDISFNELNPYLDKTWVLSVSTGVDSMVLLYLVLAKTKNIVVVHFNHQKREASIEEANYLQNFCKENNIPYEYFILNLPDQNFQDEARKARFKYLEETATKYKTNIILTAHHLNDLAETVLMKLSRGSNLFGYSGLQKVVHRGDYIYIKPLLHLKKIDLYQYAKNNHIQFFEDASNADLTYTRNRYRHLVVNQLVEENPLFLDKVMQYSNHLYEAFSFIRSLSKTYLSAHKNAILIDTFFEQDVVVQKDILALLMESHELPFNQLKLDAMLSFLKTSGPNQSYVITKDYHLKRKYQKVVIEKIFSPRPFRQVLDLNAFNVFDNMGYVTFLDDTSNISVYEIKLCYNKLALPLWARHRESGDILEMPYGHKKLKDFYIDKKIPLDQRDKDIVITDNHNRILAVLGRYYNQSTDLTDSIKLRYKRGIL